MSKSTESAEQGADAGSVVPSHWLDQGGKRFCFVSSIRATSSVAEEEITCRVRVRPGGGSSEDKWCGT